MTESKTDRLFKLFLHSDLQFRSEWGDGCIAEIVVAHHYRAARDVPKPGMEELPRPSEEQLQAIKDVLDAKELESEEVTRHDCVDELVIDLRGVRYTKKR